MQHGSSRGRGPRGRPEKFTLSEAGEWTHLHKNYTTPQVSKGPRAWPAWARVSLCVTVSDRPHRTVQICIRNFFCFVLELSILINKQSFVFMVFFFSYNPRVKINRNADFPSLSYKMPNQIPGRGVESEPCGFQSKKTFELKTKLDKLLRLESIAESPRGVQSLECRALTLGNSTGRSSTSISETQKQNVRKAQRIHKCSSSVLIP